MGLQEQLLSVTGGRQRMTVSELAGFLSMDVKTVRRHIMTGQLPGKAIRQKSKTTFMIPVAAVERYISGN